MTSTTQLEDCRIAYADCFSGISGNMFLGALLDAGVPVDVLREKLSKLSISGYNLTAHAKVDAGISATQVEVVLTDNQAPRTWETIQKLITASSLSTAVKNNSLSIFSLLAEAEAKVHNCHVEDVHFHELGGIDAIVDIVGTAIGIDHLGIDHLISSPLPMPRGWVDCAHGRLPLPAPAVCEILTDIDIYGVDCIHELVTPTGAAIIKALTRNYGHIPPMKIESVGYGAGSHELPNTPNLFRLIVGRTRTVSEEQEVEVIETNLDDWTPEGFPYLVERLFSSGALDVSLVPIQMKKGRPGFLLRVIASPAHAHQLKNIIFSETTAIGLRYHLEKRRTLPREKGTVPSPWGQIAVKKVETPRGVVLYPEYEACRKIAAAYEVSLQEVYAAIACRKPEEFTGE
jgi:uncharacterized protein (TIGR00299 family) protein